MINNLKTPTKLYLLVAVMCLFIVGIGFFGINGMKTMDQNTKAIHQNRIIPIEQLAQIRYKYCNNVIGTIGFFETGLYSKEVAINRLNQAQNDIDAIWNLYLKNKFNHTETELINGTISIKNIADKAIETIKENIKKQTPNSNKKIIDKQELIEINNVINKINKLVEEQVVESNILYKNNEFIYLTSTQNLYLLIGFLFVIAALISYYLISDTRRFIAALNKSYKKVIESEKKYRYLFENNPAFIMIWDLETLKILDVNNEVVKKYGYTIEEWETMTVLDYRPTQDHDKIKEFAQNALNNDQKVFKHIWTHLTKDGREMIMEISSHKIFYRGHKAILSLANDITEQEKASLAFKKSEEKFHSLVDHAADAIFIVSELGIILDINYSTCKLLQYSKEELKGRSVLSLHTNPEKDRVLNIWNELKEKKSYIDECSLVRKDGSLVEVEISRNMLPDGSGAIAIVRDVTERNISINLLKASQERLSKVLENSPIPLAYSHNNSNVLFINLKFTETFGYNLTDLPTVESWWEKAYPDETYRKEVIAAWFARIEQHNQAQTPFMPMEAIVQCKDGSKKNIEFHYTNMGDEFLVSFYDITARKQSENELFESKSQLALFIEHSPAALAMVDANMRYLTTSRRWLTDYNLSKQNIIGKTHYEVFPNLPEHWIDVHKRCLNGAIEKKEVDSFIREDGSEEWLKWEIHPWRKADNSIGGIIMFTEVITEQKKAEINLIKSEERHRALLDNIDDGILLIDENMVVFYQTPSVERIIGYTMADRKNTMAMDFIHPDDMHICMEQYEKAKANPGLHTKSQYRAKHKNGNYIWVEIFILNLTQNANIKAYVVIYRDITARKKLEEQQLLMSSIVNSSYDAIISKTTDGIITSWNLGAQEIMGFSATEMIGEPIFKVIPNELINEEIAIRGAILKGKSVNHFETKRIRKDGQIIDVSLTVSPIKDLHGNITGASAVLRDISERKKAEQQLREHNEKLSEIAFLQSHIVRRPVANVLGIINLLNISDPTDPTNIELIPMLETAAKELDEVIFKIVDKTNEITNN